MDQSTNKTIANPCDTDPTNEYVFQADSLKREPAVDCNDLDKVSEFLSSLIGTEETINVKTESDNVVKSEITNEHGDTEDAHVSDDFFDDLLNDPETEQKAETVQENKYSEQLRQQLDNEDDDEKTPEGNHNKRKKNQNNSDKDSTTANDDSEAKRKCIQAPVSAPKISVVSAASLGAMENGALEQSSAPEEVDTPLRKAEAALKLLELMEHQDYAEKLFDEFKYTPVVWRAPRDKPNVNQGVELMYSFQSSEPFDEQRYDASISFRIPQRTVDIARALGLDVQCIHEKMSKLNAWPPLRKKLENALKTVNNSNEVDAIKRQPTDSYVSDINQHFENTMVWQNPLGATHTTNRTSPLVSSIGSQVNFTDSENEFFTTLQNLPMMQLMQAFNEHQLLAMNDFAELISTTDRVSNAMDLYCIRQRLMDIFNSSQMPSIIRPNTQQ